MKTIKPVAAPTDVQQHENEEGATLRGQPELRALSDYELWFVGGGDDVPHW